MIKFYKMHGLGNDFVIIFSKNSNFSEEKIKFLCDRKVGIGCDLLVILSESTEKISDYSAVFYNSDGTRAETCGNALRCIGKLHYERKAELNCLVETDSGLIDVEYIDDKNICVDLGIPKFNWKEIPLNHNIDNLDLGIKLDYLKGGFALNMGNPHLIFFVEKLDSKKLINDSKVIINGPLFPEGVNISSVKIESKETFSLNTFERGVGLTSACGTGASAGFVAAYKMDLINQKAVAIMKGGKLSVEIKNDNHILITGNAIKVYEGEIVI